MLNYGEINYKTETNVVGADIIWVIGFGAHLVFF